MSLMSVHRRLTLLATAFLFAAVAVVAGPVSEGTAAPRAKAKVALWLTIAHVNDGESQLINAGVGFEDYGGIARLATIIKDLKAEALARPRGGFVALNSGDNFLAGPEFNESLQKGVPFYDSIALNRIGFDAMAIGNHEFDFGPDVFAKFIRGFDPDVPFVSANLNVNGEPKLVKLADQGRIVKSVVINEQGQQIGVIGATTTELPFISSPRNVVVKAVARAVNKQAELLQASGVDIIVMVSQLQSIEEDIALAPRLSGVDVMIAGGGNELLANEGDLLIPGDEANVFGSYPQFSTNADGDEVPIVTTSGDYKYVGQLTVGFNAAGRVVKINEGASGPIRVSTTINPDGVEPNAFIQTNVIDPLLVALEEAANNIVATSEVALNGLRDPGIRTQETNEGNLIADALFATATERAPAFGLDPPDVAIQNGGGIRNNTVIPAGPISELDVFGMVPFANFVCIVPDIPPEQLKEILENAVSRVDLVDGRFAQVSGFSFTWDANGTAQVLDDELNVTTPGTRIVEVTLDDGTPIVENGAVVPGAPLVSMATIDFSARGGDQYPFRDLPFTTVGVTYFQSVLDFMIDDLSGVITAADYPESGEGRITRLN